MLKTKSFTTISSLATFNHKSSRHPQNAIHDVSVRKASLIAVIGVGFVGAGLIDAFSSKYNVLGFDVNEDRVRDLRKQYHLKPNVTLTSAESDLGKATHFLISVPTLLRPNKTINLSYLEDTVQKVA